jgi:hypothetical protein
MPNAEFAGQRDPKVGFCSICNRASTLIGAEGNTFWRCGRSDTDATFRRYPSLPIEDCKGFEPGSPKTGTLPAD